MILVFLYGAPATGKYTVGRELATLTGFELYHNHLVVDAVLQRHAFGTSGFIAERDAAWRAYFTAAAREPARRLIFTFNPENTVPQGFIDWLFTDLPDTTLHSVALTLDEAILEMRLDTPQRQGFRKLTDLILYRELRDRGTFATPTIPRTDLTLDTGVLDPATAAATIRTHFKLG
ncbi:hypothetical protein Verru16b_02862 [Lacunisphaera limnophila]|uniref:Shikimate kinase n=1 Tax=Lacunisphaera limnophila TaxID=1838286 RepID=A0A1D8AY40_9BACT|nr:hypothetical protein [Lacunisphaera limnophila]AOS45774.1 hypothetical protein Verru16b_02862 [Lacunisphaera limnophila]